jgi:Uma2 family endonuclease
MESMSSTNPSVLTPAEYLEIERRAEIKSEYIGGRMYAMAGALEGHVLIVVNLVIAIGSQMRGRPCKMYSNDMRVKVEASEMYTYPDIAALCGERQFEDGHRDTLLNPSAIIEVLSKSTEAYDRGEKFDYYRKIETLREYVLVSSERMSVERFVRDGEQWLFSAMSAPESVLDLASIDCHVSLTDIYEGVELPARVVR